MGRIPTLPDDPPPYTDAASAVNLSSNTAFGTISDQVLGSRARNVVSVVEGKLMPILRRRADQGLSQTSIALIPSDVNVSVKSGKIIGLPTGCDDAEQVGLEGEINKRVFWCQAEVIATLRQTIENELLSSDIILLGHGEKSFTNTNPVATAPLEPTRSAEDRRRRTGGLFGRKNSKTDTRQNIVSPTSTGAEPAKQNLIQVKAFQDEICLRTVSDFGLYETMKFPVVMVQVKVL